VFGSAFAKSLLLRSAMLNIFINLLLVAHILVCLLIVLAVLMQRPKNEGLGAAFGAGTADSLFGAQTTNVLASITRWLGGLFFGLTLVLSALYARQGREKTDVEQKLQAAPKPVEATPALPAGLPEVKLDGVPSPAPETPKPAPETPKPAPEAPKSAPEAPKPAPEALKPAPEAPKPAPEAAKPAPDAPKPAPEAPKPAPEASKPAPETPKPAPEAPKPAPEAPRPAPEAPRPAPEAPKPAPEASKPAPEAPKPNGEAKAPAESDKLSSLSASLLRG